jgi:hypothetical protein
VRPFGSVEKSNGQIKEKMKLKCRMNVGSLVKSIGKAAGVSDEVMASLDLDNMVEQTLAGKEITPIHPIVQCEEAVPMHEQVVVVAYKLYSFTDNTNSTRIPNYDR